MYDIKSYPKALECFKKLRSLASYQDKHFINFLITRGESRNFDKFYDKELKLYAY